MEEKRKMKGKTPETQDITRTTLQVLFIGMLIAAVLWILRPFLTSIIWATMIVVATWPILLALQARMKDIRGFAAATMTIVLLMVVVVPFLLAITAIIEKADDVSTWVKSLTAFTVPPPPAWLGRVPLAGPKLVEYWRQFESLGPEELSKYLAPYARQVVTWFVGQVGSVVMVVIQFLVTVIIAAILYAKGETASAGIRGFARRLGGQQGEEAVILAAKAIRGVALGIVVTAVLQAIVSGIGLGITGVPAASLLTAVIFILCLAQVGPTLVLAPAVIWLYWKDGAVWGTILLVFSILAITLDNFVRPVLIRKGADLPLVLIFSGVIGGLIAFGIIGLFIGPVLLAVAYTLLKAWVSGDARGETGTTAGDRDG
jgi:predicted PurR-regulated permease PerM